MESPSVSGDSPGIPDGVSGIRVLGVTEATFRGTGATGTQLGRVRLPSVVLCGERLFYAGDLQDTSDQR
jgi:hypothetical protein